MEDINKAANAPGIIHTDRPSESSTEVLAALASFIPRTEIINRIINTTIWTATNVRPIAIQLKDKTCKKEMIKIAYRLILL